MLPATLSLPPTPLRFMGEDDAKFMRIAIENVELLERFGFNSETSILDIGSGYGRLAFGILHKFNFQGRYLGLDILPRHVRWCRENISSRLPRFRFDLIDVRNARYNPGGTTAANAFRFDIPEAAFEFSALFSVFTHMFEEEIRHYLAEIRRVLGTPGVVVATFFLMDSLRVDRLRAGGFALPMRHQLNDHTYYHNPEDQLHAIAYDRIWTMRMIEDLGFQIIDIIEGAWAGESSIYYQDQVIFRPT